MTPRKVDLDKLRVPLQKMSRGSLLRVAERAIAAAKRPARKKSRAR